MDIIYISLHYLNDITSLYRQLLLILRAVFQTEQPVTFCRPNTTYTTILYVSIH